MEKISNEQVQPEQDEFVKELKDKKFLVERDLAEKKGELSRLEMAQRKLQSLIEAEKKQNQPKKGKKKGKDKTNVVRMDIVKNEQKFKEQTGKIAQIRKEVSHLEMDLKELSHDLAVIEDHR